VSTLGGIVGWIWNAIVGEWETPEDTDDSSDGPDPSLQNAINRLVDWATYSPGSSGAGPSNSATGKPAKNNAGPTTNTITSEGGSNLSHDNFLKNKLIGRLRTVPDTPKTHLTVQPYDGSARAAEMAAATNELIEKLRNLKTVDDSGLTQAALYLRRLESSGLANSIVVVGTYSFDPTSRAEGRTSLEESGGVVFSRITLDVNNQDSLAVLAHELVHAFQNLVDASFPGTRYDEDEPVAVENEVLSAIGLGKRISNLHTGVEIPTWNKYVPWYTVAPTHSGGGAQ
jgi:hypothetical protein